MSQSRVLGAASVRVLKNTKYLVLASLAIAGLAQSLSIAQAATVIWDFNLPATGNPSLDPAYPSVGTLTLQDRSDSSGNYVLFTLDPNEANPGYQSASSVDALNIAFSGTAGLSSSAYEWVSGPVANATTFGNSRNPLVAVVPPRTSAMNMGAGYTSDAGQLKLTWSNLDFPVSDLSVWRINGTTIADNFSSLATAENKSSSTFGIFSVSPISQFPGGPIPNPSNWVTGHATVPIPAAFWLFGSGMLVIAGIARRKHLA